MWPRFWHGVHPMVILQTAAGHPLRMPISGFTGGELEPDDIPAWVRAWGGCAAWGGALRSELQLSDMGIMQVQK